MTFAILLRVALSITASAMQKRLLNAGAGSRHLWLATYALALIPAILAAVVTWKPVAPAFWAAAILAGVIDAFGNLAMVAALRFADLSIFGPLNAIRPLLALLFGWLFLGEAPNSAGALGIAITVLGAYFLLRDDASSKRLPDNSPPAKSALQVFSFRLLGIALSIVASVFLKRAALLGSAEATVAVWDISALLTLLLFTPLLREAPSSPPRRWLLAHALAFFVMQWVTIRIFQGTLLAYSFAFFQLGMVLQVLVGKFLFHEPHFPRRLTASLIMTAGSLLILWKG